ncbi:unnamed protein product [Prunus armeniaca]
MPANPKTRATSHWAWLYSHQPWPGYILTSHHTIISPLIRRDAPGHVWGLSTRRLIQRRVRPHTGPGYILTSPGLATFSPAIILSLGPQHNHNMGGTWGSAYSTVN